MSAPEEQFIRDYGIRSEAHFKPGAERVCGSCKHLRPDYSHPCTDGGGVLRQRGWICDAPELGPFSGWKAESVGCELHEWLEIPE